MSLILGVDPGLANLGWCVLDTAPRRPLVVALGVVRTKPGDVQQRVVAIIEVLTKHAWTAMVIEEQAGSYAGHSERGDTSASAILARVGEGACRGLAAVRGAALLEISPQRLRSRLGLPSNATKQQIADRVGLSVDGIGRAVHHATDAAALAYLGASWLRSPLHLRRCPS